MVPMYCLNIAVSLPLLFWPIWFARTELRLRGINPFTIVLLIALPVELMRYYIGPFFLIEGRLLDEGYQYALFMANILALTNALGTLFFFRFARSIGAHRYLPFQRVVIGRNDLHRGARVFLLIFCLALFALANAEFGIWNWLQDPRMGYQLYRTGQGHWYALATSALSVSFVLAFFANPTAGHLLFKMVMYLGMGYFLGSKGVLLAIFASGLVFLWFLRWRHLKKLIFLGLPPVFALMIVSSFQVFEGGFGLANIIGYFDYFMNAANYYRGYLNNEISLFNGEVIISSLWSYVPRAIWPDKPFVYGMIHVNEIFYPGLAEQTYTPAFGGAVEQFADFGPLGVVILGFFSSKAILTGFFSYFIFRRPGINLNHITLTTVLLFLVQFTPSFGSFFPGGLYLLLLFSVLILVRMLRRARRKHGGKLIRIESQLGSPEQVFDPK